MLRNRLGGLVALLLSATIFAACGGGGGKTDGGTDAGTDGGTDGGADGGTVVSEANYPQSVASGDPTPSSVVLWTRLAADGLTGDATVTVVVAKDENLQQQVATRDVSALAEHDHVVKVRVTGLDPGTYYWYRFEWSDGSKTLASRTGRTKTAPAEDADATVRFAYTNCQDYADRYYNAYAYLLKEYENVAPEDDLDFVEFLGDYIYETTGGTAPRDVTFQDTAGAITLPDGSLAAASLENYRTLYKTYRSDPMLQQLHERYPIIATWDDHEFADNEWDATATYFLGKTDEYEPDRKRNAEQAFFEYMPIGVGLGADDTLQIGSDILYPNTQIWGTHRFGQNVEMMITDYRTYRSPFLVPMNAFPGTVVLDAAAMGANGVDPYVNIDDAANAALKTQLVPILAAAYAAANSFFDSQQAQAQAEAVLTGNIAAVYINGLLTAAGQSAAFDDTALAALPKGLAFLSIGKTDLYSTIGSNYAVVQDAYYAYAQALAAQRGGPVDNWGADQSAFLASALTGSTATWKIVTSSVSTAPILLDLTNPQIAPLLPAGFPDSLKVRLALDLDDWDGFPLAKEALLNQMSQIQNAVFISGDIHASFVTDHGDRSSLPGGGPHRVFDFTAPSASSESYAKEVEGYAQALGITGVAPILAVLSQLFELSAQSAVVTAPSTLPYVNASLHGFVEGVADGTKLTITYHLTDDVSNNHYDEDFATLSGRFSSKSFVVQNDTLTVQ